MNEGTSAPLRQDPDMPYPVRISLSLALTCVVLVPGLPTAHGRPDEQKPDSLRRFEQSRERINAEFSVRTCSNPQAA